MSFIKGYEYLTEEPAVFKTMGGFQSLFRTGIARGKGEQELRAEIFDEALRTGKEIGEQQIQPAYEQGFKQGQKIGKDIGHFKGAKDFALHGNKYVVVSETGFKSYKNLPELLENTEFRQEVARQVNRIYEKTPKLESLRKEEQKIADDFNRTKTILRNQEGSFTSALGHIKERSRIKKNQNLREKNEFLQGILLRNTNESLGTLEGKQQLNKDVTTYKERYPDDWRKKDPKTHATNMTNYFNNYGLAENLHQARVAKRAEVDQEREDIKQLQEKRRVNIMDSSEANFRETLRNSLNINSFDTTPFFLGDSINVYNIENFRARSTDGIEKLLEPTRGSKSYADWRQNKDMTGFKKMDDLLFMPKPMTVMPYSPAPDTIHKVEQMLLASREKFLTPYKPLREEIAMNQLALPVFDLNSPRLDLNTALSTATPAKSIPRDPNYTPSKLRPSDRKTGKK